MDNKKIYVFGKNPLFGSVLKQLVNSKLDVVYGNFVSKVLVDHSTKIVIADTSFNNLAKIRKNRKDIFAVAFTTTENKSPEEQYILGLNLLKTCSLNLVFINDSKTSLNMVITPEESNYHQTDNVEEALKGLVEMTLLRSNLTFTRSTVKDGELVPWNSELIPNALRTVVNFCIGSKVYKPFRGTTAGHFACKINDNTFLTSVRKSNFNDLDKNGLVRIVTDGPDTVIAYGTKPSVGGQSQRIVFQNHQNYDCIVHFHCPIKKDSLVPTVSQREFECGSHECGKNTSDGLKEFGNLSAVYLDNHGPNIVFHRSIDPKEVIEFIQNNFDLSLKTGGYVDLSVIEKKKEEDFVFSEIKKPNGDFQSLKNGKLHSFSDKPAKILAGVKYWYKDGLLHRDNDLPAVVWENGHEEWYQNDKRHRDNDKPAIIFVDGTKKWYKYGCEVIKFAKKPPLKLGNISQTKSSLKMGLGLIDDLAVNIKESNYKNGLLHSDNDQPSLIFFDYEKRWHREGKLHRDNDQPAIIRLNGDQLWYKDGRKHRDNDLPAIIWANGNKEWYQNGNLHRDNHKPAIIQDYANFYYSNGVSYEPETPNTEFVELVKDGYPNGFSKIHNGDSHWYKEGLLHSYNDQPAVITCDGDKFWYKNGSIHRDYGLPAVIKTNGDRFWYKNDSLHRDNDLPAKVYANGDKEWYQDGYLHRDNNQPAVINSNGSKLWFKNGNKYQYEDDFQQLIEEIPAPVIDSVGNKRWFKDSKLHSYNDQPAVIFQNGTKKWFKYDKLHRDNDQPAIITSDGTKKWFKDGQRHRDNDQPAIIYKDGTKEWYQNGKCHRDDDKPAIVFSNGDKKWYKNDVEYKPEITTEKEEEIPELKIELEEESLNEEDIPQPVIGVFGSKQWYKEGKLHSYNDQPAVITPDGKKKWYKNGLLHRDNDKPAIVYKDGAMFWYKDGVKYTPNLIEEVPEPLIDEDGNKRWYKNGKLHSYNDQPATIYNDGNRQWYKNDKLHRDNDKPAIIENNGSQWWYRDGLQHRDNDLPAIIENNGNKYWYKDGNLHRDNDKPAVIIAFNGKRFWYLDGKQYKPENLIHEETPEPIIDKIGTKRWYKDGFLHSYNDQPALIYHTGDRYWYKNSLQHRDDDLPAVVFKTGELQWYKDGIQYIPDLYEEMPEPKLDSFGNKFWYKNDKLHSYNDQPSIVMLNIGIKKDYIIEKIINLL